MRMGETLRYAASKDSGPPTVDGLANFWHQTVAPDGTRTQLEAGISPIALVRAVDGSRTPAILIRSSPHKAGSEVTPWQDQFDPDHGHIRYYGDSKPTSRAGAEASPGNRVVLEAFSLHTAGTAEQRARAAPLVCFRGVPVGGVAKGHVQFCGVGVLWRAERVAQWDAKTARSFANYRFDIVVLSLATEDEQLDWAWINHRRDPGTSTADCLKHAPKAWRDWVEGGADSLPRVRRSVARLRTVGAAAQLPAAGSREQVALQRVLGFYAGRKHRFEALAELVAERVLRGQGADYRPGWLTPASSDGGADFVGRLDVGDGFARAPLVVLGQAKCELGATGGLHLARTVARLRRGWLGVFVTTGYFSLPAQREVLDDQYPLVLIHGLRLAEEVLQLAFERHGSDVDALLKAVDATYEDRLQMRRPRRSCGTDLGAAADPSRKKGRRADPTTPLAHEATHAEALHRLTPHDQTSYPCPIPGRPPWVDLVEDHSQAQPHGQRRPSHACACHASSGAWVRPRARLAAEGAVGGLAVRADQRPVPAGRALPACLDRPPRQDAA